MRRFLFSIFFALLLVNIHERNTLSAAGESVPDLCSELQRSFDTFRWKVEACDGINWQTAGQSTEGRPLIYSEFGNSDSKNTTLIFSLVHGDEITPLYLGMQIAQYIKRHKSNYPDSHIIVAPLVNPDGFFRQPRTRMNARGVDINRNFLTADWNAHALRAWKIKYKSDPRRYPGSVARSEPETIFQEDLIKKFHPQKILTIHSPLNFIDYDGPTPLSLAKFSKDYVTECLRLRSKLKATSTGFFPGSLGNYAGQELGIPTITLELPSADPKKARQYWLTFSTGIDTMITYKIP
jgi:protein MpaA